MRYKNLFIIIKKSDERHIQHLDDKKFFCYTTITNSFMKNKKFNICTPDPNLTAKNSEKNVFKIDYYTKQIISEIKKLNLFKNIYSLEETLGSFLHLKLSAFFYMQDHLPQSEIYHIILNGKWQSFRNRIDLIIAIESILSREKTSIFNFLKKMTNINYNFIQKLSGNIQKYFLDIILKNENNYYLLASDKGYFLPFIEENLHKNKKEIISYYPNNDLKNIVYCLFDLIRYKLNLKKRPSSIKFFLIPKIKSNWDLVKKKYLRNKPNLNLIPSIYKEFLIDEIFKYLCLIEGLQIYSKELFHNKKLKGIFHTTRFPYFYALSSSLSYLKQPVFLISHGTHTVQVKGSASKIASYYLALGSLFSNTPNIINCSQSIFSDDYLESYKFKYKKIIPFTLLRSNSIKKRKNKSFSKLKILHAGTIKAFNIRNLIFEDIFEYIYGIRDLCKKLNSISELIDLTIRLRFEEEIGIDSNYLSEVIKPFRKFVKISDNSDFIEELSDSDCLISLSSTTLEEALNLSIPCMSIGFTNYDHFSCYKEYNLRNNHPKFKSLVKIEQVLGNKFIYVDNVVKDHSIDFIKLITT